MMYDVSRLREKECFLDELVLRLKAIKWNWLVLSSFSIELGTSWKLLGHVYNERETTTGELPNFRDFDCSSIQRQLYDQDTCLPNVSASILLGQAWLYKQPFTLLPRLPLFEASILWNIQNGKHFNILEEY